MHRSTESEMFAQFSLVLKMSSSSTNEHGEGFDIELPKLGLKLIRRVIDIGRSFNQSGQTILNVIFQLEWLHEQYALGTESECFDVTKIERSEVVGCYLLSSKYFESGYQHILRPSSLQRVFKSMTKEQICAAEMECAVAMRYRVDKLVLRQYNFWVVVDRTVFDFKAQFKLTEKYYLKLCGFCQDIAVDLMYGVGHRGLDEFYTKSLAASIIVCAFNRVNPNHSISRILKHLGMVFIECTHLHVVL